MTAAQPTPEPQSDATQWPKHIAIIMDGNGRWAHDRDMPRIMGHQAGTQTVRKIVEHCRRLNIDTLTLYSFSSENWKRPQNEIDALMSLFQEHLISEQDHMIEHDIRLLRIGRDEGMSEDLLKQIHSTEAATAHCTSMTLVLAINYGSRAEIIDSVRALATETQAGRLKPEDIDEDALESHLNTAGLPDPDLLIRTAGERRLSNFLLWQISYSELFVTEVQWPNFEESDLNEAIDDFAARIRRYGGVQHPPTPQQIDP